MRARLTESRNDSGVAVTHPESRMASQLLIGLMATAMLLMALFAVAFAPGKAAAAVDPTGCTANLTYDPTIRTFEEVTGKQLGAGGTGTSSRSSTATLYQYLDAVVADTATNPRVRVIKQSLGTTELGRDFPMVIVGTPENIANLDAGRNDAAFWRGVRNGDISSTEALGQIDKRPAFGFITGTPHGTEPAGGDAIMRMLYELSARTDCANMRRLSALDHFLMPARNPDGRDNSVRTSAWTFDHNRDAGTRTQSESKIAFEGSNPYPSVYYIDAHQQSSGYFFPPNEDPVHAEISSASLDLINDTIGVALQDKFNDQSHAYRNYYSYDLFAPIYGDSVPSLMWGGAGMTFEKGTNELYSKQVYDHYLAMDETVNVVTRDKQRIMTEWVLQWEEAEAQGERCELEQNTLVSPLHIDDPIVSQPDVDVCGYYYLPDNHPGDTAKFLRELQEVDVEVYSLDEPTVVDGAHEIGPDGEADGVTLPAGTLWIPLAQTQKHWIQAVLGEDPFVPFYFFYDSGQWSYSHTWGMSGGNGLLRKPMPNSAPMTLVDEVHFGGVTNPTKPVLAFKTDSSEGLALAVDLLSEGVTVHRGKDAFTAGGRSFPTGTALVDASTLGGTDIAALAADRDSPVTGLDNYPVAHYDLGGVPKIGVYTNNAAVPATPISDIQGQCTNSAYCLPLFGLTQKLGFAPSNNSDPRTPIIIPVTSTDINSSATWLKDQGFTAFYSSSNITNATALLNLQDFVNDGGNFVGYGSSMLTSARSAGMTNVNSQATNTAPFNDQCPISSSSLQTPGANFPVEISTETPVGWGFDNGGSMFRNNAGLVINPATLPGNGTTIPDAQVVYQYPDPLVSYGYTCNATGTGELAGRPSLVTQEFGAGSVTVLEQDPYYRSWLPQQERVALNAMIVPNGPELAATLPAAPSSDKVVEAADTPIAEKNLRDVKVRKAIVTYDKTKTLRIGVQKGKNNRKAKVLRKAIAKKVPKKVKKKAKWVKTKKRVSFTLKKGKALDHEVMPVWVHKVEDFLANRKVRASVWEVTKE